MIKTMAVNRPSTVISSASVATKKYGAILCCAVTENAAVQLFRATESNSIIKPWISKKLVGRPLF